MLTILRLEISMEDHWSPWITSRLCGAAQAHDVAACCWRVFSIMAAVQCADDLAKDAPDKLFLADLVLVLKVANDAPEVAIATVLHVQVQVLRYLDMVALEVRNDVGVSKLLENGEFSL